MLQLMSQLDSLSGLPGDLVLVLGPDADFDELAQFLEPNGWIRNPDRASMNEGKAEPVFVSWSRPLSEDEIDYTYEPDTKFRLLEIRGPDADQWRKRISSAIATVSIKQALDFLRPSESDKKLLGLRIAATLRDSMFTSEVIRLTKDEQPLVRERAHEIRESVLPIPIHSPEDAATAFALILDVHQRRQTLRWLLHDYKKANASLIAVLESALADPDWEVRATAMLATARYDLKQLSLLIKDCEMPRISRLGPVKIDREILQAAKQAVLFQFVGKPMEKPPAEASEREKTWYHLRRCVAGLPPEREDHIWLFVHSLTEPLHTEGAPPDPLPKGVQQVADGYILQSTDIRLCWIAPVMHWLGDDIEGTPVANLIRHYQPKCGFFIAEQLFSPDGQKGESYLCAYQEAQKLCVTLSQRTGASVRLPSADEWEMAARGTDGRRFPWGNGYEAIWQIASSPWGCLELYDVPPQWLNSELPMAAGGTLILPCSHHFAIKPDERCAVRIVISGVKEDQ